MKWFTPSCCGALSTAFLILLAAAAEPAAPAGGEVTGQLLDPAGKPLAGVTVCLCARRLDVYEAEFPQDRLSKQERRDWKDGEGEWYFRDTGADGRFSFPRPRNPYIFLVSTEQGYALSRSADPAQPVTLRLTPWARLEGVVTAGDKAAGGGISIDGQYDDDRFQNDGPYLHFSARTDERGRFVFPRAPEGEYVVRRRMKNAYGIDVRVKVPAGKTTSVTLPIRGRSISGRLALPESLRGRQDLYVESTRFKPLLELPAVTLPENVLDMTPAARLAWFEDWGRTPEGRRALARYDARHERTSVSFKPDGSFTAVDIAPGTYSLEGIFFARKDGRIDYEKRLATVSYEVTVPEGDFDAPADVGVLEPRAYGTVGVAQAAPDIVFRTLDGRDRRLSEFRGKVILLDFWGTWCGPCVAEMPNLKAIHDAFGSRPDFTMVSLSVDDEPPKVERFVRENGMAWTQGVLGDRAAAWPLRLYQVSGFPTFYLIGRDGKLVAHGHWAADLKPVIAKALDE